MEFSYQPTVRFKLIKKIVDKDGQHPIKLRLTYLRKNYDRSTGFSCSEVEWDDNAGRFLGKKKKEENFQLGAIEQKAKHLLLQYQIQSLSIFPIKILDEVFGVNRATELNESVFDFYVEIIADLRNSGKIKTADSFKYSASALRKFYPKRDLKFVQISYSFLDKFKMHLLTTHSINGASVVLRALRSLYNKALAYKKFKQEEYPFKSLSIKSQPTKKRAITKDDMKSIVQLDIEPDTRKWHSRNYFIFSYLTQGMNFKDLSELVWNNIIDNKLTYRRSKTGDLFIISLNDKISEIISQYKPAYINPTDFIFPILKKDLTPTQKEDRTKKQLAHINKDLKEMAEQCGIDNPQSFTFYVARHSFATALKKLGYSTSMISEAMGHSDEKTTQIYLASFDTSLFDEANNNLL